MNPVYLNNSANRSIIFVTAFRNLNRDKWSAYSRTVTEYIRRFDSLVDNLGYRLNLYIDDSTRPLIRPRPHLTVHPWDSIETFYHKYERLEQAIIDSPEYKASVPPHRKMNPEHVYSAYNLVSHSEINFIQDTAARYPEFTHFAWIDFGCILDLENIPCRIDMSKLLDDKIITHHINRPTAPAKSPREMLSNDAVHIMGGMLVFPRSKLDFYEKIYDEELKLWHSLGVSDDDENMIYQLYLKYPDLFFSIPSNGLWSVLFRNYLNGPKVQFTLHTLDATKASELEAVMAKYGASREVGYCRLIEHLFQNRRDSVQTVFELGIGSSNPYLKRGGGEPGGSVRAFREYFNSAHVFGADIDRDSLVTEERIQTVYCNKLQPSSIDAAWTRYGGGKCQLIVDSVGGGFDETVQFVEKSMPHLAGDGIMICEALDETDKPKYETKVREWSSRFFNIFTVAKIEEQICLIVTPRQ